MDKIQLAVLRQKLPLLLQAKQLKEAAAVAQAILKADPKDHQVWYWMAQLQLNVGAPQLALESFQRALNPETPFYEGALASIVGLCVQLRQFEAGYPFAKKWLSFAPGSKDANLLCGNIAWETKRFAVADACLQKTLASDPGNASVMVTLAEVSSIMGLHERADALFRGALSQEPADENIMIKWLMALNYGEHLSEAEIYEANRQFGDSLQSRLGEAMVTERPKREDKKIRVGYVSADFRRHSVSYFFLPILMHHDLDQFEIFCYASSQHEDDVTKRLKSRATVWKNVAQLSHRDLADMIAEDQIDILVDLGGHSGRHARVPVFAMKPAPVQMTYLGYPNTLGLSRVDYRLVDQVTDPKGDADGLHAETLYRFDRAFLAYDPVDQFPDIDVNSLSDEVVFGSFNAYMKITDAVLSAWSAILKALPQSKLLLKAEIFLSDDGAQALLDRFGRFDIVQEQLIIVGRKPDRLTHLAEYNRVHVHLDTFPYNGTTTTLEAAWMGVPTITLSGHSHRARVGTSLLQTLSLAECIADNIDAYVSTAVAQAKTMQATPHHKHRVREKLQASSLMDHQGFVSALEACYREAIESCEN